LDAGPEILAGSARFIPLNDGNAQPQTMGVAISANRPIARMGRIAADLLANYAATYLADVRRAGK
jgi:hypothetical protein